MDLLTKLLLGVGALFGAFALLVVLGAFIFITLNTTFDVIEEKKQARERDKKK